MAGGIDYSVFAATGLFATTDTLGPFIWSISSGNATVYADWVSTSVTVNSNPTIDGVALPYGSIIAAVDLLWQLHRRTQMGERLAEHFRSGVRFHRRCCYPRTEVRSKVSVCALGFGDGQQVTSVYKHFAAHGLFMGESNRMRILLTWEARSPGSIPCGDIVLRPSPHP